MTSCCWRFIQPARDTNSNLKTSNLKYRLLRSSENTSNSPTPKTSNCLITSTSCCNRVFGHKGFGNPCRAGHELAWNLVALFRKVRFTTAMKPALVLILLALVAQLQGEPLPNQQFVNPIGEGADPWVVRDAKKNRYLWCLSEGNRAISIHTSKNLTSLGEKHTVWRAPDKGPYSRELWAPELHFLQGHWHIYIAASDGKNANHLAYVLRSKSSDPLGDYELRGPLQTGDQGGPNVWAIDMTPLEHKGQLYALWSGWDAPGTDQQFLYIAPMKSPVEIAAARTLICSNNDYPWEYTEDHGKGRGLNEGPQVLRSPDKRRLFITYSCGGSWLPTYKLGLLELVGDDPLDPKAWQKHPKPVFQSTAETYGVGHSCFASSLDGNELWHIYHAKRDRKPGWRRGIHLQPFTFDDAGFPQFGTPLPPGIPQIRPAGETTGTLKLPFKSSLKNGANTSYFGHHQFCQFTREGLHLGGPRPEAPINDFRTGEKLILDSQPPNDFTASVTIDFLGNSASQDAGILFRATGNALGHDAQRGYFAGLIPETNLLILGRTDGEDWHELAREKTSIDTKATQTVTVSVKGPQITLTHGPAKLTHTDTTYAAGHLGLRVVNTHALFTNLTISP